MEKSFFRDDVRGVPELKQLLNVVKYMTMIFILLLQ